MANPKTFTQAAHLLTLADDKKLSLEQLQALYNLGLLSDLFEAAATVDLTKVNRDDWKRVLGLEHPSVFLVKMNGPETTDDIVAALHASGFDHVNDYITQENFPLAATDGDIEIEITDPNCDFNEKDGLRYLAEAKLERPTYQQELRWAQQHGMATSSTKKPFVVFLHEAWQDQNEFRRVLFVYRDPSFRKLGCSFTKLSYSRLIKDRPYATLKRLLFVQNTPQNTPQLCSRDEWRTVNTLASFQLDSPKSDAAGIWALERRTFSAAGA